MKMIKYPEIAKRVGLEGMLNAEVMIDDFGSVTSVRIINSNVNEVFYDSVKSAIESTAWLPGKRSGEARKSRIIIPISFYLEDGIEDAEIAPRLMVKAKRQHFIKSTY